MMLVRGGPTGQRRDRRQARRLARSWKIEPMKSMLVRAASSR
jgi:hypothetical protein